MMDEIRWLLIMIRDQCMPAAIDGDPGVLDYSIVGVATLALIAATMWFAWGMTGRDPQRFHDIKTQVLED